MARYTEKVSIPQHESSVSARIRFDVAYRAIRGGAEMAHPSHVAALAAGWYPPGPSRITLSVREDSGYFTHIASDGRTLGAATLEGHVRGMSLRDECLALGKRQVDMARHLRLRDMVEYVLGPAFRRDAVSSERGEKTGWRTMSPSEQTEADLRVRYRAGISDVVAPDGDVVAYRPHFAPGLGPDTFSRAAWFASRWAA